MTFAPTDSGFSFRIRVGPTTPSRKHARNLHSSHRVTPVVFPTFLARLRHNILGYTHARVCVYNLKHSERDGRHKSPTGSTDERFTTVISTGPGTLTFYGTRNDTVHDFRSKIIDTIPVFVARPRDVQQHGSFRAPLRPSGSRVITTGVYITCIYERANGSILVETDDKTRVVKIYTCIWNPCTSVRIIINQI